MHQENIKGLTRPLLSSGQGVFCGLSCKNGALHPQDGNLRCTDGTKVWWKENLAPLFVAEMRWMFDLYQHFNVNDIFFTSI